jgi:hypothetical protein
MISYFLLLGYVVIFLTFSKLVKSDLFFYLSFITLLLFSGLRFDVGLDFISYSNVFDSFKNEKALFLFEPANMLIINVINKLNIDQQVIFFIYSIIIMSGVFYFIKKLSPSTELSILLFVTIGIFYFSTFNGIRQWAAIAIMLIAIVKLVEAKYVQFLMFIILASLFHISAIITLVLILFRFRFNNLQLILILLFSFLSSEVFLFLINNSQYYIYLNILTFDNKGNPLLLLIYVLILIFLPFFFGYFSKKIILNTQEIVLLNMNLMSILVLIIGYQLSIDFLSLMRVNMYFQIQLIILIPMLLIKIQNQKVKIMLMYLSIIFSFFYYFGTLYNNGIIYNLVPYKTILDK